MLKRFYGSKKGFTLAEVLITLGIIGVVAAMTIPTLIQNTNSVKFASQFKKSISTLSQAALMAQAQYDVDYAGVKSKVSEGVDKDGESIGCGQQTLSDSKLTFCGIFNNTLAGQTYYGQYGTDAVKAANGTGQYTFASTKVLDPDKLYYVYSLADGSYVGFDPDAADCGLGAGNVLNGAMLSTGALKNCLGFIDVNGPTPPNAEVSCGATKEEQENDSATVLDPSQSCDVPKTGSAVGDIFPIVFHDGTVEPASNAAKMILTRGK